MVECIYYDENEKVLTRQTGYHMGYHMSRLPYCPFYVFSNSKQQYVLLEIIKERREYSFDELTIFHVKVKKRTNEENTED